MTGKARQFDATVVYAPWIEADHVVLSTTDVQDEVADSRKQTSYPRATGTTRIEEKVLTNVSRSEFTNKRNGCRTDTAILIVERYYQIGAVKAIVAWYPLEIRRWSNLDVQHRSRR